METAAYPPRRTITIVLDDVESRRGNGRHCEEFRRDFNREFHPADTRRRAHHYPQATQHTRILVLNQTRDVARLSAATAIDDNR